MENSPLGKLDWNLRQKIFGKLSHEDCIKLSATCRELHHFIKEDLHMKSITCNDLNIAKSLETLEKNAKWIQNITLDLTTNERKKSEQNVTKIFKILNNNNAKPTTLVANYLYRNNLNQLTNVEFLESLILLRNLIYCLYVAPAATTSVSNNNRILGLRNRFNKDTKRQNKKVTTRGKKHHRNQRVFPEKPTVHLVTVTEHHYENSKRRFNGNTDQHKNVETKNLLKRTNWKSNLSRQTKG